MIKKHRKLVVFAVILLFAIFMWERIPPLFSFLSLPEKNLERPIQSLPQPIPEPSAERAKSQTISLHLTLLGDIMCHPTQYQAAQIENGYDFTPSFKDIAPYTSQADITLANLETTLAGKDMTYSGYPSFNTPEELALAIKKTLGVDIVSTANNHSLDRHFSGLTRTISFLEQYGLKHTGTYATEEDSHNVLIENIKGVNIAFLSYTYGTNGVTLPPSKSFAVNYINKDKIRDDALKATKLGADLIIASIHWGEEYANTPTTLQTSLAQWLFTNTDIDIISGNHVHAVQPIEFIKAEGKAGSEDGLVIYAQGNFISDQKTDKANKGILVDISLEVDRDNRQHTFNTVQYTPTWVDETPGAGLETYRVLNVNKALQDFQMNKDPLLSDDDYQEMLDFKRDLEKIILRQERIQDK